MKSFYGALFLVSLSISGMHKSQSVSSELDQIATSASDQSIIPTTESQQLEKEMDRLASKVGSDSKKCLQLFAIAGSKQRRSSLTADIQDMQSTYPVLHPVLRKALAKFDNSEVDVRPKQ